ncbi:hypothetical protein NMG60_11022960 [Bertholletia excelsa]
MNSGPTGNEQWTRPNVAGSSQNSWTWVDLAGPPRWTNPRRNSSEVGAKLTGPEGESGSGSRNPGLWQRSASDGRRNEVLGASPVADDAEEGRINTGEGRIEARAQVSH